MNENEKASMRDKLILLDELTNKKMKIIEKKRNLNTIAKTAKSELSDSMKSKGTDFVEWKGAKVIKVDMKQQRKPTMETLFQAIKNIAGTEFLEDVKRVIKKRKVVEEQTHNVMIVKLGEKKSRKREISEVKQSANGDSNEKVNIMKRRKKVQ